MENVDSFTQEYVERARQRREMLNKKLAESSPRRKRSVLTENNERETITVVKSVDDDSPNKRQCLRDEEQSLHPDTPAIKGVRSRMKNLASQHSNWENENMDHEAAPVPSHSAHSEEPEPLSVAREKSPAPKSRRNRLAALAQNINNWEDDLSHPTIKKEETVKKVWQPPKPVEREPSPPRRHPSGPSKPSRTYETEKCPSPVKFSPQKRAVSPVRITSPRRDFRTDGDKVVSSLTVKLGSSSSLKSQSPGRDERTASPRRAASPVRREPSPLKARSPIKMVREPSPVKSARQASPVRQPSPVKAVSGKAKKNNRRESFEPSAQPVSARLAGWQQRVDQVESESMDPCDNAASRMVKKTPVVSRTQPATLNTLTEQDEPTQKSVHSRMANWEHKSQQEERSTAAVKSKGFVSSAVKQTTPKIAVTSPKKSPMKAAASSPTKSPTKVAPATKVIQSKLAALETTWQDNEIAEKIRAQKQADMDVLENRWKNGVLQETEHVTTNTPKPAPANTVPAAPPVPASATVSTWQPKSPVKKVASPIKHVQAPKTPKEDARNKIRQVHSELIAKVMDEHNHESSPKPVNENPNFENKLKTLGFEIQGDTTAPTTPRVATLDLKEQRAKERQQREASEKNQTPKKTSVQVQKQVVTTVLFDDGQTISKTESRTPVTKNIKPAGTPSSLYGLIRKQSSAAATTPSRAQHTPTSSRDRFQDSFSSDETSFDESVDQEVEIRQRTTVMGARPQSLVSTASEYSDTQTEDLTTQSEDYSSSESEDEEGGLEYTMDETVGSSGDDADEELTSTDEAFHPPGPVPAPRPRQDRPPSPQYVSRKLPPQAHPGHPDHKSPHPGHPDHKSPHKPSASATTPARSTAAPPKHPRLHQQQTTDKHVAFTSPGGSVYRSDSSGSEKSILRDKPYSIDNYRSSANVKRNAPEPRMTIIRRSEHFDPNESIADPLPYVPEDSTQHKIQSDPRLRCLFQELQELVNQEQIVIQQASNALNQCCGSNSAFAGSQEAVECHRILLMSCKKREAYIAEMHRLKTQQPLKKSPKGSLTISDIRLPLKNDFVSKLGSIHDTDLHYFIVLFRHGAHVIFTQMVGTHDALIRGSLDIPNLIKLSDVRQDFRVDVEVYHMSIIREQPVDKTPKKKKTPKKLMSASKKHHPAFQSPGGPNAVRTTNFTFIASLPLTMSTVDKTHFSLDRVPFSSPLQGTIHMRLRCLMEVSVEEKGFLTMFDDVNGLGAWHRRWCVLKHNTLSFWKYPDDVRYKDPIGTLDLKTCISDVIGLVPRDICARPNTLELLTVRRQQRGEMDTLVTRCHNTMTTTKHWISADTKEDREVWTIKMNEALRNLRDWNPDALRPIKRQQKS